MRQKVFVLGANGKVGREFLSQVSSLDSFQSGKPHPTDIVGLADSKHFGLFPGGVEPARLSRLAEGRLLHYKHNLIDIRDNFNGVMGSSNQREIIKAVNQMGLDGDVVFVDATANHDEMSRFHSNVIASTNNKLVTANKNPIALGDYDDYYELTSDPTRYKYSATVGAGIGIVPWLHERAAMNDTVRKMEASLSGTGGFITTEIAKERPLSEVIAEAVEEGYAEPDFRDDLNGLDIARKLVIMAREAGYNVDIKDVDIERFLPDEYFDEELSADDCLNKIAAEFDQVMAARIADAKKRKKSIKYVGSFNIVDGKPVMKVGFKEFDETTPFGQLSGTDNRIEVTTDIYNPENSNMYKVEGPGAGLAVTAAAIRQDLFTILPIVRRSYAVASV